MNEERGFIETNSHDFMCQGAKKPFDHPHIYLTFGKDNEKLCPYCNILYKHKH